MQGGERMVVEEKVRAATASQPGPSACLHNRIYLPENLCWSVVLRLACHSDAQRTGAFLWQRFWWRSLDEDIRSYDQACVTCSQHKNSRQAPTGLLQPLPVPSHPWSHISVNFITGLPCSRGNTVILTIVDRFTKMAHFVPLLKLPTAKDTAQLLVQHVFQLHSLPLDVMSHRGPQFSSVFWSEFCKLLWVTPSLSSGFYPQSNGQTERMNQDLEVSLWCMVSWDPACWSSLLVRVEYTHKSLPSLTTGISPFQCVFSYQPPLFWSLNADVSCSSALAYIRQCRRMWAQARATIRRPTGFYTTQANRRRIPAPVYRVSQKVWFSTRDLPLRVESRKLAPRFVH